MNGNNVEILTMLTKAENVMKHPLLAAIIEEENEKVTERNRKAKETSYVPSPSSIEKIVSRLMGDDFYRVSKFVRATSPFMKDAGDTGDILVAIVNFIRRLYGFSNEDVQKMSAETKIRTIELTSPYFREAFRRTKSYMLDDNLEMYDDVYQEQKLKYLIEHNGKEPKLYSDEEYNYIESCMMRLFINLSRLYFELEKDGTEVKKLNEKWAEEWFAIFLGVILKRFDINQEMLRNYVIPYWYYKVRNGFTHLDVKEYQEYRISPLNDGILQFDTSNFDTPYATYTLVQYSDQLDKLSYLLRKEDFENVLFSYISFAETAAQLYDEQVPFKKHEMMEHILKRIPTVVEHLKRL